MRRKILLGLFMFLLSVSFVNRSFSQAPTISSFSPSSGPVGTLVTINGTNLNNLSIFTIGGVSAITISNNGTQLVGMVMPGAVSGIISINNIGGTVFSSGNFTIIATSYPSLQQGQKLVGSGNIGAAKQGNKVAISADGNTAIVGGTDDNSNSGAVWIYKRSGNLWSQDGNKLVETGNIGAAYFGCSVSISADGKTVLIGGELDNSGQGAAWVFTQNAGVWTQQGNKLIGIGNTSPAHQGHSVSLSADGNTALIGGPNDNYLDISGADGAAWVFKRTGNTWSQDGNKLVGTGSTNPAFQGGVVALSGDGQTAMVSGILDGGGVIDGMPTAGAVWMFIKYNNTWTQQGNKLVGSGVLSGLKGSQGWSIAISADGNTGIIGGVGDNFDRTGAAWIFTRNAGVWTQQGNKLVGTGVIGAAANQGGSVGISADGNTVIVGGINDNNAEGAVWVYTRSGNVWTQQSNKLIGTGNIGHANQGISACLSADGTTAIVGGMADNTDQGAAWVFASVAQLPPLSPNPYLSNLTLSSGVLSSLLNPLMGFSSPSLSYTSSVSNATNSITITPTAIDPNATIGIRYTGPSGAFIPVTSGSASAAIPLNVGNIGIEIKVTAQDASTKTYLVVVTRQAAGSTINSFSPNSGPVGTLVTINGSNLNNPNSITIGGVPAIVISNNGTQLVAMVMPGAVSGSVVINTATGNATGSGSFTVKNTAYPSLQQGNKLFDASSAGVNFEQGRSVAISADGNTVIVGKASLNGIQRGAMIYVRNGDIWTRQGDYLTPPDGIENGWTVALSADGNTAVLAGISNDSKKDIAWVFVRNSGIWSQQGDKLEANTYGQRAGYPLAISGDGNTIIFGAPVDYSIPDIANWFIFKRTASVWTTQANIQINNVQGGLYWAVALSSDGNTALIGHSGDGVWVYNKNGNSWIQQGGNLNPHESGNFCTSLAISADGNTAIIGDFANYNGADNSMGAAFIFNRTAGIWSQKTKLYVGKDVQSFGVYTSLSADGKTAIIEGNFPSNNTGGNWVFTNKNGIWTNEGLKFASAKFIYNTRESLAISSEGNTAIVGVPDEDGGGAYIYVADPLVDAGEVSGGNSGGLESKSLGNAVVKRVYAKAQNNLNGPDDYSKMQKVIRRSVNLQATGIGSISDLKLSNMMPDISSQNLVAYNSTPTDIIAITNAKEVLSTDFTSNQQCKAVAFATKTQGELYDHTKPICDRLKGASLEYVETIKIAGFDFIKYTMHNEKGQLEYATSFSIGTKSGRPDFTVQSTWLLKDYVNEENMYNFQLWAATPELVTAMVTDVLNKLQNVAPVKTINNALIPNTYILSGKRESTNLNMVVANSGNSSSGYFLVEDKSNEDAISTSSRKVPFTISANGKSSVSIPMNDNYESTITMYVNNAIKDIVYMSDGSWYADYNKATTTVSSFNVTNDNKRVFTTDEYPVFRNVELKAVSKDYVSIVKLMKGGGLEADVSGYKGLKITASGGHTLHIVLVKNSIVNWKDQYYADIQLEQDQKDYFVSLDKFISEGNQTKIKATDISAIVFSVQTSNTTNSVINTTLSNISFTKEDLNYLASLDVKEIQLYPNPVTGNRFSCNFVSSKSATLTLSITDANGRLIQSQQVNAIKGNNSIPVTISINNPGIHIVSLEGLNEKYQSKKLVVAKY